ncbi:MAG: S9 family peptidase [Candidatus Acetothermia bacterium]
MAKEKEYGSWKSPIKAEEVASGTIGLSEIQVSKGDVYWLETRPDEAGRTVPVRLRPDGRIEDVIPKSYNARSRVHEYGGGSYLVGDGVVYFTNFEDQRLYKVNTGKEPEPLTPKGDLRFADISFDERRDRLFSVCEDHSARGEEPRNYLVSLDPEGREEPEVIAEGHDFYSSPRISPDGIKIAWVTWDHPDMPWDETELHLGELNERGDIESSRVIAGRQSGSVLQPKWSPDGFLYYVSDEDGWWNIYRWNGREEKITEKEAEYARPQWQFGISTYEFFSSDKIVYTYTEGGRWHLAERDLNSGKTKTFDLPYTQISSLKVRDDEIWFVGGAPKEPQGIRRYRTGKGELNTERLSTSLDLEDGYLSLPDQLEYSSEDGEAVYGFYYSPQNEDYVGPDGEKPPLLVISHGGPTSASGDDLSPEIQFWTSRGMAVLDVNYRGSTGFGREYRNRLKGEWGVVDVDDCVAGARYLVEKGLVDSERLLIRGGSAGGYTTLAALTFRDVFDGGASYYGVSDPAALAEGTHKFESRYLDGLIGPYPGKEDLYEKRSPIHHAEEITAPVIFFQGTEDRVVPPSQSEEMYSSLKERGITTAYLPFEGEQHGFRREENIARALEAELFFYSRILGFELGEEVEEVDILNPDV